MAGIKGNQNGKHFSSTYQPTANMIEKREKTKAVNRFVKNLMSEITQKALLKLKIDKGKEGAKKYLEDELTYIFEEKAKLAKKTIFQNEWEIKELLTHEHFLDGFKNLLAEFFPLYNKEIKEFNENSNSNSQLELFSILDFKQVCQILDKDKVPYQKQIEMVDFAFNYDGKIKLILGARGYGKTEFILKGIVNKLLQNNNLTFLIISKSDVNARKLTEAVSFYLKKLNVKLSKDNSGTINIEGHDPKQPNITGLGLSSESLRSNHCDYIICDDIVNPADTRETEREFVEKIFAEIQNLGPVNIDKPSTANIIVLGQPVHPKDLYSVMRQNNNILKMELPYGSIPEIDKDMEVLKSTLTEKYINANYFLKIDDVYDDVPFKNCKVIKYYELSDGIKIEPKNLEWVAFIDPSMKGKDYTAMCLSTRIGISVMIVAGFIWQKSWDKCLDDILLIKNKLKIKNIVFETNGLGDYPIEIFRNNNINVVGKNTYSSKQMRINNAGVHSDYIKLYKTDFLEKENMDFINQVRDFEVKNSKHDDAPDALAQSLILIGCDLDGSLKKEGK